MSGAAADFVLAIDAGGTAIKVAAVARDGRIRLETRRPTALAAGWEAVVEQILETAVEFRDIAEAELGRPTLAAGIVVPGIVDEAAGVARRSTNIGWRDVPLRSLLEKRLELPVSLGHDVRAGALAEGVLGAARGSRHYFFMTIGTGIGGALVLAGRPYIGPDGTAGEIGHLVVRPGGAECSCGARGCLEAVASAAAIAERYRVEAGLATATAELVAERARSGDELACRIWDDTVAALATAIAAYTMLLAPQLVVVGGGLALAGEPLLEPLAKKLASRLTFQRRPRLVAAELGDLAGCLGAALSAWLLLGVAEGELAWSGPGAP